jgi:NAD(P)-dependent dehydrogenase (short-subunit alcohol dehydrogenase family)
LASPAAVLVVTGSLAISGQPGLGLYNASKSAVAAFAQSLAVELASRKVRVNCLSPGPVDTPFWGKLALSTAKLKELKEELARRSLTRTLGNADDVAEAAVFLASDAAKSICGQEIICDGGYSVA